MSREDTELMINGDSMYLRIVNVMLPEANRARRRAEPRNCSSMIQRQGMRLCWVSMTNILGKVGDWVMDYWSGKGVVCT